MLWHYTTRKQLIEILESRVIRTSPKLPQPGQTPAAWFTTSLDWEPTAAKRVGLKDQRTGAVTYVGLTSFEDLESVLGVARIGVDDGPEYLTFQQYERVCSPEHASYLVQMAILIAQEIRWEKNCGPGWWRACLTEVRLSKFRSVQVYDDGRWV